MSNVGQDAVDALVNRIKPHGADIREAADAGDDLAADVMRFYAMFARCPEAGSLVCCEAALDRWLKRGGAKS